MSDEQEEPLIGLAAMSINSGPVGNSDLVVSPQSSEQNDPAQSKSGTSGTSSEGVASASSIRSETLSPPPPTYRTTGSASTSSQPPASEQTASLEASPSQRTRAGSAIIDHPTFLPPLGQTILTLSQVGLDGLFREVPLLSCSTADMVGEEPPWFLDCPCPHAGGEVFLYPALAQLSYDRFCRIIRQLKPDEYFVYVPPRKDIFRPVYDDSSFQAAVMRMRKAGWDDVQFYVMDNECKWYVQLNLDSD